MLPLMPIAALIAAVLLTQQGQTLPETPVNDPEQPLIGMHVPWAIGGPAIERDGSLSMRAPEYPDFPMDSVRLWDTRTAWLNLEPRQDQWDFTNLDAHIAQAKDHGVTDITLVLWGTPSWAARDFKVTDAPWLGPGSASMPQQVSDWQDYVMHVATRYKGQINAYEIGNEPNSINFWSGTDQELVNLVHVAAATIHQIDPAATVVAPAPVFTSRDRRTLRAGTKFWNELDQPEGIDSLSFHWYPSATTDPSELGKVVAFLRARAQAAGLGEIPLWLTEVNYFAGSMSAAQQEKKVIETNQVITALKLPRAYWYAWTDLGPQELMQFGPNTPAERGYIATVDSDSTPPAGN